MSEFIDFEVGVENTNQKIEEEEDSEVSDNDSLKSFIGEEKIEGDRTFYHKFKNVTSMTMFQNKNMIRAWVILKKLICLTSVKLLKKKLNLMNLKIVKKE